MSTRDEQIWWVGEMPLPRNNLLILHGIYVLEQWLRRIALAALMAQAGSRWPPDARTVTHCPEEPDCVGVRLRPHCLIEKSTDGRTGQAQRDPHAGRRHPTVQAPLIYDDPLWEPIENAAVEQMMETGEVLRTLALPPK